MLPKESDACDADDAPDEKGDCVWLVEDGHGDVVDLPVVDGAEVRLVRLRLGAAAPTRTHRRALRAHSRHLILERESGGF